MHANNEVGTLQPTADIARVAQERGIPLHADAAQSVGKIPTRVDALGVDLLTVAGHKLYGRLGDAPYYAMLRTLILDHEQTDRQIAWIDGAVGPAKGSAIELNEPTRDAEVVATRLSLSPDGEAPVFVYLRDAQADEFMPKDAGG